MTLGEQLSQEGRQEGVQNMQIELAKNFLLQGVDINIIAKGTRLSVEQLKEIVNQNLETMQ